MMHSVEHHATFRGPPERRVRSHHRRLDERVRIEPRLGREPMDLSGHHAGHSPGPRRRSQHRWEAEAVEGESGSAEAAVRDERPAGVGGTGEGAEGAVGEAEVGAGRVKEDGEGVVEGRRRRGEGEGEKPGKEWGGDVEARA